MREELREELPKLFAEIGAITVYATAEPSDALLLGGRTATLSEGRVTQFGRTLEVYRRPERPRDGGSLLRSADEFHFGPIVGGKPLLPGGVMLPAHGPLAGLAR